MSSTSSFSALGVGSGIDFQTMIDGLVSIEGRQKTQLQTQLTRHQSLITAYQAMNTSFGAIRSAADALILPSTWKTKSASSTSTNVTASATTSAVSGTFAFSVQRLATAQVGASLGWAASADTVVGSGSLLIGIGGNLGLRSVVGSGLSTGAHTFEVTTASTGASKSGSPLADSVVLDGTETLTATIGGTSSTFTLAAGTYSRSGLADAVKAASGGKLIGSVNADGSLKLATADEGSAATLSIDGGTGLAKLGLSVGAGTNGTNGVITVDGIANTVSNIKADGSNSVVLNSSAGTVTATFSGGLRSGTSTMKNVDLGDGKLSSVASIINNANAGVNAAVVQVGAGQFKLQLQSTKTGTDGAIATNFSAFSGALGDIRTVMDAQNALLQVGTGASAYTIASSSNTMKDVMPGVTLNLKKADPNETVTVAINGDADAVSGKVKTLVDSINSALSSIKTNSTYNAQTKSGGIFLGNFTVQALQRDLMSTVSQNFPSSVLKGLGMVGITAQDGGGFKFDEAKFKAAFAEDPNAVASLFLDGGTTGATTGNKGFAEQISALAKKATDSVSGSLTAAIKGENKTVADLNKQVDRWTERLDAYRKQLVKQFAAVDTMISNFKSQQSHLAGQLASLPTTYN